ncbi:MAG TPA: hypothetical protein VN018_00085 [Brevundimonas sp.]|nr:hypothetical protein [Brevundimonas sp.]
MAGVVDLTGRWTGVYFYPHDPAWNANDNMPATPFTAELTDTAGSVIGKTVEPDLLFADGPDVRAVLEGRHDGLRLTFTKTPDGRDRDHVILYDGEISADGDSVSGRWTIPGSWSGDFRMQRRTVSEAASEEMGAQARS